MSGRTVWLASYPKSGSTWFRAVYAAWRTGDPFTLATDGPIAALRASLDESLGLSSTDLTDDEVALLRPLADDEIDRAQRGLHLRKLHDALLDQAGRQVVSSRATHCAVYLVRDPRDVAVSFAHHSDITYEQSVRFLCSPTAALNQGSDPRPQLPQHLGAWSHHVSSWIDDAPFPVTVVRYEDALLDPVTAFGAALRRSGFTITGADLAASVAAAGFDTLRKREEHSGFAERWSRTSPFFRSGTAGGWRAELSGDQVDTLTLHHGQMMERLGYLGRAAASADRS